MYGCVVPTRKKVENMRKMSKLKIFVSTESIELLCCGRWSTVEKGKKLKTSYIPGKSPVNVGCVVPTRKKVENMKKCHK